jgi:hypothetical protein
MESFIIRIALGYTILLSEYRVQTLLATHNQNLQD